MSQSCRPTSDSNKKKEVKIPSWHVLSHENILFSRIFVGYGLFTKEWRVERQLTPRLSAHHPLPQPFCGDGVIAWWRWEGMKTWHFMTATSISFWPLKMCVYWPERRNVKRVMKVKYFHSVIGPPCGLNWGVCAPPPNFFVSGMPVLTTTCSVRTWSTAKSILTSSSTSFTPAMCGDSGMWFRATLRRISSPILPHLAS